jgi:signal peptidase I
MQKLLNETVTKEKAHIIKELQDELFHTEGKSWFKIISGSMYPLIDINDRVLVKKIIPSEVRLRDIILFKFDDVFVTHRVIKILRQNGKTLILQKGDAGNHAFAIDPEIIVGRVVTIDKKGSFLSLESGRGKIISQFLGFLSTLGYRFDSRMSVIKSWLRDKPGSVFLISLYRIIKKPYKLLNQLMIKIFFARIMR